MSFKTINYEEAHTIVDSNKSLFWDGWTIVDWKPYKDALYKKNGLFRDGKWGVSRRYTLDENGWKVPAKYVDR